MTNPDRSKQPPGWAPFGVFLAFAVCVAGCGTVSMPSVNLSEPGWTTRQGRPSGARKASAGNCRGLDGGREPRWAQFHAIHQDAAAFRGGAIHGGRLANPIYSYNKTYSGRGAPPERLIWLYLPRCLAGLPLPEPLTWRSLQNNGWHLKIATRANFWRAI